MKIFYLIIFTILFVNLNDLKSQNKIAIDTILNYKQPLDKKDTSLQNRIVNYFGQNELKYQCKQCPKKDKDCKKKVKIISDLAFDTHILKLYTKAAADNEGIVKNGSAFSYNLDKDKSTVSINHVHLFEKCKSTLLNININGTSDGSFLYVQNSTKSNYTLEGSAKLSSKLSSTVFFSESKCDTLQQKRTTVGYSIILAEYKQLLNTDTSLLSKLIVTVKNQINPRSVLKNSEFKPSYFKKLSDSLIVLNDSLAKVMAFYKSYKSNKLAEQVNKKIADFELATADLNGYKLHWLDYGLGYKLLNNNIFDSTVFTSYKITQKNFHRVTGTFSYSFLRNTKQSIVFVNIGINGFNSYAVEALKKENFNFSDTVGVTSSFKGYNNLIGNDININYFTANPFVTLLYFPGKDKQFGVETSMDGAYQSNSVPIYNGRFGIVYSVIDPENKDKSRTTVGLFLTLTKYDTSNPRTGDFMGVGFRVGVPFNKLINEKK